MPIERHVWMGQVRNDYVPDWPCPHCSKATLEVIKSSYHSVYDRESKLIPEDQRHYECMTGRFICLLRCRRCEECCSVSGKFAYDNEYNEDERTWSYTEHGTPLAIIPPPRMISIPKDCPKDVEREVFAAFSAFWNDLAASLNHIRQAIELVLDHIKLPRTTITAKNKNATRRRRSLLTLHARIEELKRRNTARRKPIPRLDDLCEKMLALKHLGNAGSHPKGEVERDDVFDGFDILESVLHDFYSDHNTQLARVVKSINKAKGPWRNKLPPMQ